VGRSSGNDFYDEGIKFQPYKVQEIRKGKDLVVFATGSIVCDVLQTAEVLKEKGLDIGVINVHTIKPLDIEGVLQLSQTYHRWISVEEHNVIGGLGSALSEVITNKNLDVRLEKIGLADSFAKGHGAYDDLKKANGLGVDSIARAIKKL
jgi:transketolase